VDPDQTKAAEQQFLNDNPGAAAQLAARQGTPPPLTEAEQRAKDKRDYLLSERSLIDSRVGPDQDPYSYIQAVLGDINSGEGIITWSDLTVGELRAVCDQAMRNIRAADAMQDTADRTKQETDIAAAVAELELRGEVWNPS
jgi:hypothetical protein